MPITWRAGAMRLGRDRTGLLRDRRGSRGLPGARSRMTRRKQIAQQHGHFIDIAAVNRRTLARCIHIVTFPPLHCAPHTRNDKRKFCR